MSSRRVWLHVILFLKTADRFDAGDPRHGPELRTNEPVLHRPEVGRALESGRETRALGREIAPIALPAGLAVLDGCPLARRLIMDRPHVNLAKAGRDRPHARHGSRRQVLFRLHQTFIDLLAGKIDVDLIVEDGGYLREAVARKRSRVFKPGDAGERGLERKGDLLFDVIGRERGGDRIDLHLNIGDVGHGVDRQLGHRPAAEGGSGKGEQHHKPALVNRKGKNARDHDIDFLVLIAFPGFTLAKLGLEQECVGDRYLFACGKAGSDFDSIFVRPSHSDITPFKSALRSHEDHSLAVHRLECRTGNAEFDRLFLDHDAGCHDRARAPNQSIVIDGGGHACRACIGVHERANEYDTPFAALAAVLQAGNGDRLAFRDHVEVRDGHCEFEPDPGKIGDGVEIR